LISSRSSSMTSTKRWRTSSTSCGSSACPTKNR
jgi:hypothetical protein